MRSSSTRALAVILATLGALGLYRLVAEPLEGDPAHEAAAGNAVQGGRRGGPHRGWAALHARAHGGALCQRRRRRLRRARRDGPDGPRHRRRSARARRGAAFQARLRAAVRVSPRRRGASPRHATTKVSPGTSGTESISAGAPSRTARGTSAHRSRPTDHSGLSSISIRRPSGSSSPSRIATPKRRCPIPASSSSACLARLRGDRRSPRGRRHPHAVLGDGSVSRQRDGLLREGRVARQRRDDDGILRPLGHARRQTCSAQPGGAVSVPHARRDPLGDQGRLPAVWHGALAAASGPARDPSRRRLRHAPRDPPRRRGRCPNPRPAPLHPVAAGEPPAWSHGGPRAPAASHRGVGRLQLLRPRSSDPGAG